MQARVFKAGICFLAGIVFWSAPPVPSAPAAIGSSIEKAKAFFEKYVDLGRGYDLGVADLYSDDAVIKNKRTYPTGEVREMSLTGRQIKELIRQVMPMAKARGDRSSFSDCRYQEDEGRVRITCRRYSEMKKYAVPHSLLVGPNAGGVWLIFEEIGESRP